MRLHCTNKNHVKQKKMSKCSVLPDGPLAQLVRALPLELVGRWFESDTGHIFLFHKLIILSTEQFAQNEKNILNIFFVFWQIVRSEI